MSECMDNFLINVRAKSKETFALALKIAFAHSPSGKAAAWFATKEHGLVILWHADESKSSHDFPSPISVETAIVFAWEWLLSADRSEFELVDMDADCDHFSDAHCNPAYRIFCENWGYVADSHYAICAILPVWAWVGK